ncbi:hypothetical protein SBBP1_80028 [Burkholderiales bacterium]|nr:hypothetical protein SBBP1_80028 [Burkholderiales bacterium]
MNGHNPPAASAASGPLPYLSASQSSALMRSAAAISCELMAGSFPQIVELVRDSLATRWDFDIGSPLVQRLLATKSDALRDALLRRLPQQQDYAFERLMAPRNVPAGASELDAAKLELVRETDDGGEAIAARAARRMRGLVEEPLRDLQLIVAYLCNREQVPFADNPFGPDVIVPALLQAAIDVHLHPEAWVFFLTSFEPDVAGEIGRISQSLLDHFRAHGIEARAIRRARSARRASAATVPPPAGALAPHGATEPNAGAEARPGTGVEAAVRRGEPVVHGARSSITGGDGQADARAILKELLGRLQANVSGDVLPPLTAGQGPVAPMLLDALAELQNLGLEGIHGALFAGTPAGSINAWREHLISQSTRTVDKLTIEIVGMMFDHVMRDAQVPLEIKALLSRLQFPVLKAALLDAAFFASSSHPARRLIDRIAAAAVGWEPYGDENERFRAEVDRLVRQVMLKFDRDVGLFETALNEFETFLGDIEPRESDPIARAKRALEEAEKREVLSINTTIQVRRAFERVELEPYLRDFLIGPWVQVLVQASLRDDHTKGYSKSFREAIHEIVWSVQPKATAEERRRLVELIPVLTRIVRDGLALIRYPQRDQEDFLQSLMAAHAFAVKPTDQATYIKNSLQSSEIRAKMDGLQLTATFPLTAIPGGVKVPTRAVLRAAAEHQVELSVPAALTDVGVIDKTEEARMDHDLSHWTRGSWFELWDGEAFLRARLRWISPLRTMFMFSSGPENRAHVMSPDLIHSYLRRGFIRPLESAPLTERAAHAVVADFANVPNRAAELASRLAVA